ncbi:MAG TPA: hypothetical protein VFI28_03020 [Candidatus Limnocylindrales bacterium]|nr:hypothetical protein [Candidatus Limnocylindrales bacterium]
MASEPELRETSDRVLEQLTRLAELETAKRQATPGTAAFVELSRSVEAIAAALLGSAREQTDLANTTRDLLEAAVPGRPTTPIAEVQPSREPSAILAEWRDAERRIAELEPGSPALEDIRRTIETLRDEYRRAFEARR